ncbi:MAG: DUF1648 domain-containing protein [Bacteroidota bacterium]
MNTNIKNNKPKIKISRTALDWAIELIAFFFLLIQIVIPLVYYKELPVTIPTHFNSAGLPDGFGSRSTLWILPVTSLFMYLLMTILEAFPQIYNFPVEITPENAPTQYRMATRLIRILKTVILIIFSFISYQTIKTAIGTSAGLGKAFLPVFLLITFGVIIVYVVWSLNNRHNN